MKDSKFLCVGLIMHDILVQGVQRLPEHWEDMTVGTGVISDAGGGASNSARTFGRLGAETALAGRIGNDAFGRAISEKLANDHVSLTNLVVDETEPTGTAVALVHPNGQRCFTTVRGCNKRFCTADLENVKLDAHTYVHINGYFQLPALEPHLGDFLKKAKSCGSIVSFDTASWDPSGKWFETIEPFAESIDYFFANDSQLKQLTGYDAHKDGAAFLIAKGVKNVIAKLGGQGSISYDSKLHSVAVPAYDRFPVVDTTGAGDSFDAAYMVGIAKEWDTRTAAAFANTVAGMNCSKAGATAGVPDFQTALAAMKAEYDI